MKKWDMEQSLTTSNHNALTPIAATPLEMRTDAVRFPRIGTMNREDAILQMVDIVLAAAVYRGTRIDKADAPAIAAAIVDEILADNRFGLKFISFAEIRRAVRTACLETEMYGVNVASIYRAIVAYAKGEGQAAGDAVHRARQQQRTSAPQVAIDAAAGAIINQIKNQ